MDYEALTLQINFNQDIFKAIDKIRNKHKQQANIESTTGNESISKAFLEDTYRLEKSSYYFTEKVGSYY